MAPTPDREAFLRRLEEQQRKNQDEISVSKELEYKETHVDVSGVKKAATDDIQLLQFLNQQCGLSGISLGDFDGSSLDLLRQFNLDEVIEFTSDEKRMNILKKKLVDDSECTDNIQDRFELLQDAQVHLEPLKDNENRRQIDPNNNRSDPPKKNSSKAMLRTLSGIKFRERSSSCELSCIDDSNNIETIPDDLSAELSRPSSPEWQKQLLDVLEKQNEMLLNTRNQIESLEKQVQHLQTLLLQTPSGTPTLTTQLPPDQSPPPVEEGYFAKLQAQMNEMMNTVQNTRTARAIRHAYDEARRQNIHANLDVYLFVRMMFFVFVFGGKNPSNANNPSFFDQYRLPIFAVFATFIYFLQIGVIGFLYRFLTKDLYRLEAEDLEEERRGMQENGEDQNLRDDNGDGRFVHGVQREREGVAFNRNIIDDGAGNPDVDNQNENDGNDNTPVLELRYLTDGGINNERGILNDLKYFVGSFILSLIPTWKPVRVEEQETTEPEQQQQPGEVQAEENGDVAD